MTTATAKQRMKVRPAAAPLRPEELVQVRALLARTDLEPDLDAGEVARLLGLARRTILDAARDGELPGAWKPSHNRVRIPVKAVEAYRAKRRVVKEGKGA